MRYTVEERHQRILELVRMHGTLRVTELAKQLGISTVTARRDVESLAGLGRLERAHGEVSLPGAPAQAQPPPLLAPVSAAERNGPAVNGGGPVLGMVAPQEYYFGEIIKGAREAVAAVGGRLVLGLSGYGLDKDVAQAQRMLRTGVDGLLLTPTWMMGEGHDDDRSPEFGVPTVLVERRAEVGAKAARLDWVCPDHASGAGLGVRHLAELGHRGIALVAGNSPTALQVEAGYEAALRLFGLERPEVDTTGLYDGPIDPGALEQAADRLAGAVADGRVTAALVLHDTDALMVVEALHAKHPKLRVPEDLALIAYGDEVAALSDQPLTAVAPPKFEVGREAARLLLQRVGERTAGTESAPRHHLDLMPELRVRMSCGAVAS